MSNELLPGKFCLAKCSHGRLGVIISNYPVDGIWEGVHLRNGKPWQSNNPQVLAGAKAGEAILYDMKDAGIYKP